jgi:hypothetical protein
VDAGDLTIVSSILDGGDGAFTGASCSASAELDCTCFDGTTCEQPTASFFASTLLLAAANVTLAHDVLVGGVISQQADGSAFTQYGLFGTGELADIETFVDGCDFAGCSAVAASNTLSPGQPLLAADRAHGTGPTRLGGDASPYVDSAILDAIDADLDLDGEARPNDQLDAGADER